MTLLPVVLSAWGPALDRYQIRRGSTTYSRAWARWADVIVNRRWIAAAIGLVLVIALAIPALSMNTGQPSDASLGGHSPAAQAFHQLRHEGVPSAVSFPAQVLVQGGPANAQRAAMIARHTDGVWSVFTPQVSAPRTPGSSLLTIVPTADGDTSAGTATVTRLRQNLADVGGGKAVQVGGNTAANMDFTNAIYKLGAGDHVRVPVRHLDGLRGVRPGADA